MIPLRNTALPALAALLLLVAGCDGSDGGGDDGAGDDTAVGVDTIEPGEDTSWPAEDTTEPGDDTMEPGEDTMEPGEDTMEPGDDTMEPGDDTHEGPCPPMGPFGTEQGDIAGDAVLIDCDGVEHSIHGVCGKKVTWIFSFSGW